MSDEHDYKETIKRDQKDYKEAMDEDTSPERLAVLAKSPRWFVREAVASNPNTGSETLNYFLTHKSDQLRILAKENLDNA